MNEKIEFWTAISIFFAVLVLATSFVWQGIMQAQASIAAQQQASTTVAGNGIAAPASFASLPSAYVNIQYNTDLQLANPGVSSGDAEFVSTLGQLPPGLSVQTIYPPCVPPSPGTGPGNCPADVVLSGITTQLGTYAFNAIFSVDGNQVIQPYKIKVLSQDQAPVDQSESLDGIHPPSSPTLPPPSL